jgi:hypothetical protein
MASWDEFEVASTEMASAGRELLTRGHGSCLLATVRADLAPRIHPVSAAIVGGRLCTFVLASAKLRDLEQDGRYALHTLLDIAAPDEFMVRGRAQKLEGSDRAAAAAVWSFEIDETYVLFGLEIESALLGRRRADEWPPRYTTWVR